MGGQWKTLRRLCAFVGTVLSSLFHSLPIVPSGVVFRVSTVPSDLISDSALFYVLHSFCASPAPLWCFLVPPWYQIYLINYLHWNSPLSLCFRRIQTKTVGLHAVGRVRKLDYEIVYLGACIWPWVLLYQEALTLPRKHTKSKEN